MTYSIIAQTNGYIAQKDAMFSGKTEAILHSGLSLKKAYRILLDMYNDMFSDERSHALNWGLAVIQSKDHSDGARPTNSNKTRSFEYDSRIFTIVEEDNE